MKSITYFYLKGCPYCAKADQMLAQLKEEKPEYNKLEIHYIDENSNPEYCDLMDYMYVPCFYVDGVNCLEGRTVTKEQIGAVLDKALED